MYRLIEQDSEFAIGGVTIGSSADYVQSIYGEPTHISDKVPNAEGGYSYSYAYGSSFYIFFDANTNVVTGIFSTANNGLTNSIQDVAAYCTYVQRNVVD